MGYFLSASHLGEEIPPASETKVMAWFLSCSFLSELSDFFMSCAEKGWFLVSLTPLPVKEDV